MLLEGSDPQVPGLGSISQCGNAPWFPDPMSASSTPPMHNREFQRARQTYKNEILGHLGQAKGSFRLLF